MPFTAKQWREREIFLVDLQDTRREIAAASQNASELLSGINSRSAAADVVRSLEQQLRGLRRSASSLASEFNGQGVRQGSLHGPTESHRERKRRIDLAVAEVLEALERADER